MLVDGDWCPDAFSTTDEDGAFDRQTTMFRSKIGQGEEFPVEAGRYHLYICRACPWAHRTAMTRSLKALEDVISLSLVEPVQHGEGWEFSDRYPDPHNGESHLMDIYRRADESFTGRVTVPFLWDTTRETIVNNESIEITRMLDTAFHELSNDVDLYPDELQVEVDRIVEDIYDPINNGVYRCGFAESQAAYDSAVNELFDALGYWEEVLERQRYLAGERLTEADIAMFATLVRFDHVYHTNFQCNRCGIHEYHNLWNYTKELAQLDDIWRTVNMEHIMTHYYTIDDVNPRQIVAAGPDIDFMTDHDRDRLSGGPPTALS